MKKNEKIKNYQELKAQMDEQQIDCELVAGHLIRSDTTEEEGGKLCFLLGTLLTDYMMRMKISDRVYFGDQEVVIDERNIYRPDLFAAEDPPKGMSIPRLVIEILAEGHVIYDCLDKSFSYMHAGIGEYWLIDMTRQHVYTFNGRREIRYQRYAFDQKIECTVYPGFDICISDVMWRDTGCLRDLAVFYRFKEDNRDDLKELMLQEPMGKYESKKKEKYTTAAFYEWINVRKNLPELRKKTELICGEIHHMGEPDFRQQSIRGNLYFVIRQMLRETGSRWQLCFSPTAVEMKQKGILDSILMPDLFLLPKHANISDNVYRGVPPWIIEIATPATAATDYIDKAQIYQFHGVREYWIVNDWKQQVLVMNMDSAGQLTTIMYDFDDAIPVEALEGRPIIMREVMRG